LSWNKKENLTGEGTEHAKAQSEEENYGVENSHAFVMAGVHVGREVLCNL